MKVKTVATTIAAGIFAVAFLRNGTAQKLVKQGGNFAQTFTGGTAKIARRI
jgi:hypothetical protein